MRCLATQLQSLFDRSLSFDLLSDIVAVAPQLKSSLQDSSLNEMSNEGDDSKLSERSSVLVSMHYSFK